VSRGRKAKARGGRPTDPVPAAGGEGPAEEDPTTDLATRKERRAGRMHVVSDTRETCVLFGIQADDGRRSHVAPLAELRSLAETDDLVVAGELTQARRRPDPRTYLGSGKVEELATLIRSSGATLAVCDDDLDPTQGRNLQKVVPCRVVDRTELILDIFLQNARTRQAQLQVELARLQYSLPRLKRLWTHLDRVRGGIGARGGAGEKQIQMDRTLIKEAISRLKKETLQIQKRKQREISSRAREFTVSLVGYTNAGKSSLMNRLTGAGVLAENRLFSTLDTRTRLWALGGGRNVLLSDTVGFIRGLPHHLVASFHATLEEAIHADLLLHVVDGSHPDAIEQVRTVEDVLGGIGAADRRVLLVINKADLVQDRLDLNPLHAHDAEAIVVSARSGRGIEDLVARVRRIADADGEGHWLEIPMVDPRLQQRVRTTMTVLEQRYDEERVLFRVSGNPEALQEIVARGARVLDEPPPRDAPDD
jgi:GTP-binding protein HflX